MSRPKFIVFKLKDLKIPVLILLVALVVFIFLMVKSRKSAETFAPSDNYKDGTYIASIALSDANLDLLVNVEDKKITSVSLDGLDPNEASLYKDLEQGILYVNDYVTSTQSLEITDTQNLPPVTTMLMDAVKVALSDDKDTSITTTYQKVASQDVSVTEATSKDAVSKKDAEPSKETAPTPKPTDEGANTSIVGEEVVD